MASITEILKKEEVLESRIYLYKEGVFWKAYQYSAYRVGLRQENFKLKKKFIKTVSCEVVSLGFPDVTLERIFEEHEIERINEKQISIPCGEIDKKAYQQWFDEIPLTENLMDSLLPKVNELRIRTTSTKDNVIRRIKEFRIEEATPLTCMEFIISIRKELRE